MHLLAIVNPLFVQTYLAYKADSNTTNLSVDLLITPSPSNLEGHGGLEGLTEGLGGREGLGVVLDKVHSRGGAHLHVLGGTHVLQGLA